MSEPNTATPTYTKRRRSKLPIVIGIIAVIALAIVAASVYFANRGSGAAERANSITVGLVLEPTSLDVRTNSGVATPQILADNVYQGLVGIAKDSVTDIVPVLATEMPKVNADGTEYLFTLRKGVKFHSGDDLTVDDVVDSLSTTLVPENVGFQATVTAEGDDQVKITLAEPNSMLLWQLADRPGLILKAGDTTPRERQANGTGPFEFSKWKQGDSITLTKNAHYWGEPAKLDTVVFRFFPEGRAAVNALRDGDVDVHTALLPTLRAEFEGNANFKMQRAAGSDVFTLAYNNAKAPFNDQRVRTALSMALDGTGLVTTQNGDAEVLGGPITRLEPGYEDLSQVNAYDPAAARELLAEAGQQNLSLTITAPNHYDTSALDLVRTQLAEIGVAATVKPVEFPTWLQDVYVNHDFDLSYVDHAEARDFANYANPKYYFGYNNPQVQELYAQALATTDSDEADSLLKEAARIVAEDAPAKWLFNYTPTNVVSTKVSGFPTANTNARVNLAGVSVK